MQELIREAIFPLRRLAWQTRARTKKSTRVGPPKRVLLMPPVTRAGSLGDEAMVMASINELHRRGCEVTLLSEKKDFLPLDHDKAFNLSTHQPLLGATASREQLRDVIQLTASHDAFLILGADMMDGGYTDFGANYKYWLLNLARSTGCDTRLLGFSVNATTPANVLKALKRTNPTVSVLVRDPRSLVRVQKAFPSARGVADVAFLANPREPTSEGGQAAARWQEERHNGGSRLMGFNPNSFFLKNNIEGVRGGYIALLASVLRANEGTDVMILAHDRRPVGDTDEFKLSQEIADALKDEFPGRVFAVDNTVRCDEAKWLLGKVGGLVSGRMHAVVGALGSGTPAMGMVYQGKFEGLFDFFQLEDSCLEPSDLESSEGVERLSARVCEFLQQLDDRRARVAARLDHVKSMSRSNFTGMGTLA